MKFLHRIQQGILAICLGILFGWSESQAATLMTNMDTYTLQSRRLNGKSRWGWWCTEGRTSLLTADDLRNHLSNLKDPLTNAPRVEDCFKELGRLLLAQAPYLRHNIGLNNNPDYMQGDLAIQDLYQTDVLRKLKNHLFDHGHLGWYPNALAIKNQDYGAIVGVNPQVAPRGIFNINPTIRGRILPRIQDWVQNLWDLLEVRDGNNIILRGASLGEVKGYNIDPPSRGDTTLRKAAINLITCLFSSNTFDDIQIGLVSDERFTIDARYHGVPIQGIDYTRPTVSPLPPTNCLGLQSNGTPTNRICLVVGVNSGRIYIASLFPEG